MIERTLVFVDTSYLLASFYNSFEEGARGQLEISLATVVQTINRFATQQSSQPVQRQFWYDGIPDSGPQRYQRTLRVIEGVQLRAGQLIEWGDRRTQKAVDTLLVADMVRAAVKGQCTDMVLISGDADMIPGVREAVDAGVRVHLMGFGWDSIASSLRHRCDTVTVVDPREEFADAMQIRVLEGPVKPQTPTVRPRPTAPGDDGHRDHADGGIDMVGVDLREDRAHARSVASDESAQTAADEERVADEEEAICEVAGKVTPSSAWRDPMTTPPHTAETIAGAEPAHAGPGGSTTQAPASEPAVPAAPTETAPIEPAEAGAPAATPQTGQPAKSTQPAPSTQGSAATGSQPAESTESAAGQAADDGGAAGAEKPSRPRPNPSMMARHRRPLRSKYVPLSEEVWTSSGEPTPADVGQQYATWWYENSASEEQREKAHLLSGGVLPPEIDRPLLQFACQMLNEFSLTEYQRVALRDGFHEGIRAALVRNR